MMKIKKDEREKRLEDFRLLLVELSYDKCEEGFRYNNQKISKLLNISKITVNKYIHELQNRNILKIVNNHYEVGKYCKRINWINSPTSEDIVNSKELLKSIKKNRKIERTSKINISNVSKIIIINKIDNNNNSSIHKIQYKDNNNNNNITCYPKTINQTVYIVLRPKQI